MSVLVVSVLVLVVSVLVLVVSVLVLVVLKKKNSNLFSRTHHITCGGGKGIALVTCMLKNEEINCRDSVLQLMKPQECFATWRWP